MNKNAKTAFTLAEVLITMVIISFISLTTIKVVKNSNDTFSGKDDYSKVYKVIENFDYAFAQIRDLEKINCPMGKFINKTKIATSGTMYAYEKVLSAANATAVFNILKNYIKFDEEDLNFCDYSGYCNDSTQANNPAGKLAGDIYVGINMYESISDCPDYYVPDTGLITVRTDIKTGEKPKCWGNILIDINGAKQPNSLGEDVYVFGLDENGIHH